MFFVVVRIFYLCCGDLQSWHILVSMALLPNMKEAGNTFL